MLTNIQNVGSQSLIRKTWDQVRILEFFGFQNGRFFFCVEFKGLLLDQTLQGTGWLSGRVLGEWPQGRRFAT